MLKPIIISLEACIFNRPDTNEALYGQDSDVVALLDPPPDPDFSIELLVGKIKLPDELSTSVNRAKPCPASPAPPDVPEDPDVPDAPVSPDVPEVPFSPEVPDVPAFPEVPEDPVPPDVPDVPVSPDVPEDPVPPDVPEVPFSPEVPDVPAFPEVPLDPVAPEFPEVPSITTTSQLDMSKSGEGDPIGILLAVLTYTMPLYLTASSLMYVKVLKLDPSPTQAPFHVIVFGISEFFVLYIYKNQVPIYLMYTA